LRSLGVKRYAALQWANVSPESKAHILAYTAGINAYLQSALKARPPEFIVLGLHPEPWTPEDTMAWAIMMAWDLGGNWSTELLRMRLALKMPVERINQLLPAVPGRQAADRGRLCGAVSPVARRRPARPASLNFAPESGWKGSGSNNWVVHGSHTDSGKPLLANDPHLKLTRTGAVVLRAHGSARPQGRRRHLPGLPGVVLGQNRDDRLGLHQHRPDVQDLYIERIKPDDPTQYQTPDGWAQLRDLRRSHQGARRRRREDDEPRDAPRPGDLPTAGALPKARTAPPTSRAMHSRCAGPALDAKRRHLRCRAPASTPPSRSPTSSPRAQVFAPMQNMLVADREGHIAFVAAGQGAACASPRTTEGAGAVARLGRALRLGRHA
jgi:penicillin amidase